MLKLVGLVLKIGGVLCYEDQVISYQIFFGNLKLFYSIFFVDMLVLLYVYIQTYYNLDTVGFKSQTATPGFKPGS